MQSTTQRDKKMENKETWRDRMRRSREHPIGFPGGVNKESSKEDSSIGIKGGTEDFSELIMMNAKTQETQSKVL